MALQSRTFSFLFFAACAVLVTSKHMEPNFRGITQKLIRRCQDKGYQPPKTHFVFNTSNSSLMDAIDNSPKFLLTALLSSVMNRDPLSRIPKTSTDKIMERMWNCTHLRDMIVLMKNSSENATACYMQAFMAPISWMILTAQDKNNTDMNALNMDDFDTLLWSAKDALRDLPSSAFKFPPKVELEKMKRLISALWRVHANIPKQNRARVAKWAKEQITENYFNCTMKPPSGSDTEKNKGKPVNRCKPSLQWLNMEAMTMMGPYLSDLSPRDIDSAPKEKLCEFFLSAKFNSTLSRGTRMSPSLGKKWLQKIQQCFNKKEQLAEHIEKLGPLACFWYKVPDLTPELSSKLLPELDGCDHPRIKQLKKKLIETLMSKDNTIQMLYNLGRNVTFSKDQAFALIKRKLGGQKCRNISHEELKELQSMAAGLPQCVLKRLKAADVLNDPETMENIAKKFSKAQKMAMLQRLTESVTASELMEKVPESLRERLSLNFLKNADVSSLGNKTWNKQQALFLAKKVKDLHKLPVLRKYISLLRGVSCAIIDKVAEGDTLTMTEEFSENQQFLDKVAVKCAARRLFAVLEKEREDYFQTITEEELDMIPSLFLIYLPPSRVKDLPDSVCPTFLDKMEEVNMTFLPRAAPSRPKLLQKALDCLTEGEALSTLTVDDTSRLRLMDPDVLKATLEDMALCRYIPADHRSDLIQLIEETYGNLSEFPQETVEALWPLLSLDDSAVSALPNQPWMKDIIDDMRPSLNNVSEAVNEKFFNLTVSESTTARKRRTVRSVSSTTPTAAIIEELGDGNVYWTLGQLNMIPIEVFRATVQVLGTPTGYSVEQLSVLSKKATETFGSVSTLTEEVVQKMGCINRGFSDGDLEKLPFSLDNLDAIKSCGWTEQQMRSMWKGIATYNNLTAQKLGVTEMAALNQFMCGLSPNEISQLNKEAFKDAVGSLNDIRCSYNIAKQLKSLAVTAFGEPNTWTEAKVNELGNMMAGLDATELASLNTAVLSYIRDTTIPLIPAENFAALTEVQLEALGSDNAAKVTTEQLNALSAKQRAAIERAAAGSLVAKTTSGAPSLSAEGISFMKLLLVFLLGFLLL
uniref:Otoancorin n=1 Tax=Cynoglossus semilaevis TaxID=244447 RepID=A0A3P8UMC8_CYNSE